VLVGYIALWLLVRRFKVEWTPVLVFFFQLGLEMSVWLEWRENPSADSLLFYNTDIIY
jgi:hypothetical protein